eukprot:CAMPEP_0116828686 /NCGR_PEP_ID=MMETSP0418-20121206/3785_1 /TAXON_ID=1158023 /ORGANISM="Astrosyne radiata, Strain 13vi08-1A" /LENGTH=780 /DNA_ID=CAMNT_0004457585 /DNA_START=38 /DNA_END=2380 /DNA_ORIENTATION=+
MKYCALVVSSLLVADQTAGFMHPQPVTTRVKTTLHAMEIPPPPPDQQQQQPQQAQVQVVDDRPLPTIERNLYKPSEVRYSDFIRLVKADQIEKVTFGSDGRSLTGVDIDGTRFQMPVLPNDPELLNQLDIHRVEVTVLPQEDNKQAGGLQGLILPALVLAGLIFLTRRSQSNMPGVGPSLFGRAGMGGNPFGGMGMGNNGMPNTGGRFIMDNNPADVSNQYSEKELTKMREDFVPTKKGFTPAAPQKVWKPIMDRFKKEANDPRSAGPANRAQQMGRMTTKINLNPDTGVTFADVAGCQEQKRELEEFVDYLKNVEKYARAGLKLPKGVLLSGPPGTGKTLLAKALAGEAGVPFISTSGSEFVEMFVGVGAARVRDVFKTAKKNAPCIIFLDELDAVAKKRGGRGGANQEREATLNQFLVEMDGFDGRSGIILVGATNRPKVLDKAMIRPGRFDRKITIELPDFKGRAEILGVHARGKPLDPDVDLEAISRRTPGFSGAQLQNLMNEAALESAKLEKKTIGWEEIDLAVDRVLVGREKQVTKELLRHKKLIAYHEAGHAVLGALMPDYDEVQKISIVPRQNGAGGLTFFSPQEQRLGDYFTRQYMESQLAVALGGRVAEEVIAGQGRVTSGASNDYQQMQRIAKTMVYRYGMSPKLGRMIIKEPTMAERRRTYMRTGKDMPKKSDEFREVANKEVARLTNNAYLIAKKVINDNLDLLHHLAEVLMEQEVVSSEEFQIMLIQFKARVCDYGTITREINESGQPFKAFPDPMDFEKDTALTI